jgi:hypothetical protein
LKSISVKQSFPNSILFKTIISLAVLPTSQNKPFMKAFLTSIVVTILTFTLLTSCKKEATEEKLSDINYKIKTTNRSGLVQWTSGTGSGKQVEFKGTLAGSRVEEYVLSFNQSDFFASSPVLIGKASVRPGSYTDLELNFEMIPSRNPSLQLKGTFSSNGVTTPITLNLEQYLEIMTKKTNLDVAAGKNYTATLVLDLNTITNGITQTMLANAQRTNGEIIIAYYSNASMYSTIINNINNKVHEVEFSESN